MARGFTSFQKRQKEQQRKEKQQEKMAKRLAKKNQPAGTNSDEAENDELTSVDGEDTDTDTEAEDSAETSSAN